MSNAVNFEALLVHVSVAYIEVLLNLLRRGWCGIKGVSTINITSPKSLLNAILLMISLVTGIFSIVKHLHVIGPMLRLRMLVLSIFNLLALWVYLVSDIHNLLRRVLILDLFLICPI